MARKRNNGFGGGPGSTQMSQLMMKYKYNAKRRGIYFCLTKGEFKSLLLQSCRYCAFKGRTTKYEYTDGTVDRLLHNGIDRVDSEQGYTPENCVPCCTRCNTAKTNMPLSEFRSWIKAVHDHLVLAS